MKNQKYPYIDMYGREVRLLKEGIKHQGIGGQEFAIDEQVTRTLTNGDVFFRALNGNWACHNFVERRPDFNKDFKYKLYYGKVNNLGYIVAEDEFEVE